MKPNYLTILLRYSLVLFAGLGNLVFFYKTFTFPTVLLSAKILSIFRETVVVDNLILFGNSVLEIANSCVAGSAFYLLFVLAMSIPIRLTKRIWLLAYLFGTFFLVNAIRIVLMAFLLGTSLFSAFHLFFWHVLSTVFLLVIWFSALKLFRVKEIPFYTDFISIKKSIDNSKKA